MVVGNWDVVDIVDGYARGYFLMEEEGDGLQWYGTRNRTLIPLDEGFRYPRSLQRILNQNRFSTAIDCAFEQVIQGCANRTETWISPELMDIYRDLHRAGWAHSFETWQGDRLAGGVLGIAIGGAFVGESMFFAIPNGSKVALVKLVDHLRQQRFTLFDAQLPNPHLARFGAVTIPQSDYVTKLQQARMLPCRFVPARRSERRLTSGSTTT